MAPTLLDDEPPTGVLLDNNNEASNHKLKRIETLDEYRVRKMLEKQRRWQGEQAARREKASQLVTKQQLLQAHSAYEFIEIAETLIPDDWLMHVEALTGDMYCVAAFGLFRLDHRKGSFDSRKATFRIFGFITVLIIQIIGGPIVFLTTVAGWGVEKELRYKWENWRVDLIWQDWMVLGTTKLLGILFLFIFLLNGLFVLVDMKQTYFKLYNTLQYLKRSCSDFQPRWEFFLYIGALVNTWTVMWCCISSFVVVGANCDPQQVIFDSLGLLFLYNLDDIDYQLGFVDDDDWPGTHLGWVHKEMVKMDWQAGSGEDGAEAAAAPETPLCIRGCGRPRASGRDDQGRLLRTCCRGCAMGGDHDPECAPPPEETPSDGYISEGEPLMEKEEEYAGGEQKDWNVMGYVVLLFFRVAIVAVVVFCFVMPVAAAFTPFIAIVPDAYSD